MEAVLDKEGLRQTGKGRAEESNDGLGDGSDGDRRDDLDDSQGRRAEKALLTKVRSGDSLAFGTLVEGTMRRTHRMAVGLVGSVDDAWDLSQEAYVRAYGARRTIDPSRPFFPWLYQILRRLCFNFIRDRGRHLRALKAAQPWLVDLADAKAASRRPDHRAELAWKRQQLQVAIEELPDREREVFVLKELEGLKYREIAEWVEIPLGTVMSRLYSARQRLAARLEETR